MPDTHWSIVLAAQGGDDEAIRKLTERYRPTIVRFVARRSDLQEEAEDVAQEVFIALLQQGAIGRVDRTLGRFRTFLFTLTRWVLSNFLAHKKRKKRGGHVAHVPLEKIDLPDDRTASDDFDREWVAHLIKLALRRLAEEFPHYHAALERLLLHEESYDRIAEELGKSRTEIRNAIYRGRKKLVVYLREEIHTYSTSRQDYEEEVRHLEKLLPSA